tara:strand:- start:969 stop:1340 length:372 start_codon:yes stop_codon:yes gene_type:complete
MKFDHFSIRTSEPEIVRDFFIEIIGLRDGPRPPFDFPGYWMYEKDKAIVHIIGDKTYNPPPNTGVFDHVAFEDYEKNYNHIIKKLDASEFDYHTRLIPGVLRRQVFVTGPHSLVIELNYPPEL